jgi:hypothetical protein
MIRKPLCHLVLLKYSSQNGYAMMTSTLYHVPVCEGTVPHLTISGTMSFENRKNGSGREVETKLEVVMDSLQTDL